MPARSRRFPVPSSFLAALLLGAAVSGQNAQAASDIVAGPMVGHVTDHSARIWMQLSVAKALRVECFDVDHDVMVTAIDVDVEGPTPFVVDVVLNQLEPNKTYRIQLSLDGTPVRPPGPELVIRTAPPPGMAGTFTVGFGSALLPPNPAPAGSAPIFKAVTATRPRAFLFLGDSGQLPDKVEEFPTTRRLAFRSICDMYSRIRRMPDLVELLRTTATYGLWDDRDFGTPDSDRTFVFAKESQAAFQRCWPNPGWGTPANPGCYSSFSIGDVDFFLLDDRMYRDPENDPQRRTMLGQAQMEWLKKGLSESRATFKILASSSQVLAPYPTHAWANYQPEQRDFLKWLGETHIPGVLCISGTRGWGELTALQPQKDDPAGPAYPLLELTSAGLAGKAAQATTVAANPDRAGEPVLENNFGTLDFGGQREHRFVTLRLRDESGKVRLEQTVFASQLQGP